MNPLLELTKNRIVKMAKESDENPTVDYNDDMEFLNRIGMLRNQLVYERKVMTATEFETACKMALAEMEKE